MKAALKCVLVGTVLGIQSGACEISVSESASTDATKDCVVLLHGLCRTGLSMKHVERSLARHGYNVVTITYPAFWVPVERLADEYLHHALARRVPQHTRRVHFVTHSMGGILLRHYLASHRIENLGRVVMVGPPNRGSKKADLFKSCAFARWLAGPNLFRLGTGPDDLPQKIGAVNFEAGIIAGDRPLFDSIWKHTIPSDGIVAVESTKVAGMKDFTIVHCSHTFMVSQRETLEQIGEFIQYGRFRHSEE
jgi:pimeloyl-ACP methyl ester carboxylesterase